MHSKQTLKYSLFFPVIYLIIIWLVKAIEFFLHYEFSQYGILPRHLIGIRGIVLAPLIHGDWGHLISNSGSFLVLCTGLFYFYRNKAFTIFFLIYFISGILVWITARYSLHIGASGIIYGLAAFLFSGGIISKEKALIAIALLVVFLYGSMMWGVLPVNNGVSWESHLAGSITGIFLAFIFVKPQPKDLPHSDKTTNNDFNYPDFNNVSISNSTYRITFHFKPTKP